MIYKISGENKSSIEINTRIGRSRIAFSRRSRSANRANSCEIVWGELQESIDPSFPWIWSLRPCVGIHRDIETSSQPRVESLELWLRPLLGTNEAKRVDTKPSRQAAGLSRFSRVIPRLTRITRAPSISLSFFLESRASVECTQLPIDSFKAPSLTRFSLSRTRIPHRRFMYFLRSPRANIRYREQNSDTL